MNLFTHGWPVAGFLNPARPAFLRVLAKTQLLVLLTGMFCLLIDSRAVAQSPTVTVDIGYPVGSSSASGVAYGNSVYVCIRGAGVIYTSPDGENWTKVSDAGIPAGTFNRVTFGAGVFVVVGHSGLILTSADGLTWTTRTSGTSNHLYDVQYIQSKFLAVGVNQTVRTSSDGITWSTVTLGTGSSTDIMMNITYGNGVFVIGARQVSGGRLIVYSSSTAASNTWTYQDIAFAGLNRVLYLKDKFFIFCSNTNVYTSSNGTSWTNSTASLPLTLPDAGTQTLGSPNQCFNGFYDGSKIYLFGYGKYYSSYGSIFSSTDGVNFTLEPQTAYIVCQGSAYLNNKYFQYGNEGIISSDDGLNYEYPGGSYNAVATNGSGYVGVGAIGDAGVIYSSPDFSTWTSRASVGQNPLYGVVYANSKYLAVGEETVMESTDNGVSWTEIASPATFFSCLTYGAGLYVAGGYDASNYLLTYSADGINWTTANTDNNYYFKTKFVNSNFFALGYSEDTYEGIIMHSADGINWTDITPNLAFPVYYFNDVIYDGSKYHFMGMEYVDLVDYDYDDFFSISTSTVNDPNSFTGKGTITTAPGGTQLGGYFGEGAFAYSNGRIAGAVNDLNTNETFILYTTNGTDWTAEAVGESSYILGALASGNKFQLLGTSDGKLTLDFGSTLPVKLSGFTATMVNGQSVLKWQTVTESNSSHFIVQHSTDGIIWQNLGTVAAAGQSNSLHNYRYIHQNPAEGYNYYRLNQVDADGKQQFSNVVQLQLNGKINLQIYPNPATGWLQVELPGAQPSVISLFNMEGKQVYRKEFNNATVKISLQEIPRGVYLLEVKQNGQRFTRQVYRQ